MKHLKVKDLMVPISQYATIEENADMPDAIIAIESELKRYGDRPYRHQALVVVDKKMNVVGRLSQIDMMRAFEPNYTKIGGVQWFGSSVMSKEALKTLRESFQLWEKPIDKMYETIKDAKVKDYMQVPTEGEFVDEADSLNIAMHRIVMGRHHSLLVTKNKAKEIVGILRSTDLFNALYDMIFETE